MKSQAQWTIEQLKRYGEVSRNGALQNRITRLSAIILYLNQSGWKIEGDFRKTEFGKDYVYTLIEAPKEKKVEIQEVNGEYVAREIYV